MARAPTRRTHTPTAQVTVLLIALAVVLTVAIILALRR